MKEESDSLTRLQKYLAACGVASRREAEKLIEAGRVQVNGQPAALGASIEPGVDQVTCDGKAVQTETLVYVVLNKPKGVVTTARDAHAAKTVLDCLAGVEARVFAVGRLDKDVEGVLLLTNDGELAFRLAHPKYEVDKVYVAWVRGRVEPGAVRQLETGVLLEDGVTSPAQVSVVEHRGRDTLLQLTLHEGRKREVKRMCAAVGHPVRDLQRSSMAGIQAGGLRAGEWRYLEPNEVAWLRRLTELS